MADSYIGLIHKEDDSDFGVSFPDFPGCVSAGQTLDEARALATEALLFHIEGMREDGEEVPAPSSLDAVLASDPKAAEAVVFVVPVKDTGRAVRVNVTIEESVLERIDRYCDREHVSRSALLAQAAQELIGRATR